jgi:hypothetical protein
MLQHKPPLEVTYSSPLTSRISGKNTKTQEQADLEQGQSKQKQELRIWNNGWKNKTCKSSIVVSILQSPPTTLSSLILPQGKLADDKILMKFKLQKLKPKQYT